MPTIIHYQNKDRTPFRDKLKRWVRKISPSQEDTHCYVCGKELLNRNNEKQIVLYCSKRCRSFRHNRKGFNYARA